MLETIKSGMSLNNNGIRVVRWVFRVYRFVFCIALLVFATAALLVFTLPRHRRMFDRLLLILWIFSSGFIVQRKWWNTIVAWMMKYFCFCFEVLFWKLFFGLSVFGFEAFMIIKKRWLVILFVPSFWESQKTATLKTFPLFQGVSLFLLSFCVILSPPGNWHQGLKWWTKLWCPLLLYR